MYLYRVGGPIRFAHFISMVTYSVGTRMCKLKVTANSENCKAMDVKRLNVTVNFHDLPEGAYQIAKHVRPNWKWEDVRFRVRFHRFGRDGFSGPIF